MIKDGCLGKHVCPTRSNIDVFASSGIFKKEKNKMFAILLAETEEKKQRRKTLYQLIFVELHMDLF